MVVSEHYVRSDLPLRCYRGLIRVCRQIRHEFKQAVQHMVAAKQLQYELNIVFSHGRPFFSVKWLRFPALSPTINHLFINVDLRTREPFREGLRASWVPHENELAHLLEDSPQSFAAQLFDYIAILLKTLANLLAHGDPCFSVIYTEMMTLNFSTPTTVIVPVPGAHNPVDSSRRVPVNWEEAAKLHDTMCSTLNATSKAFHAFNANHCDRLFPLIQIGSLRFANEGEVWGEGHNLVLAHENFQWLRY